jgi:hypothetical protein
VNLNGALDINKPEKQAFIAPKRGFQNNVMHQLKNRYRRQASSHI